MEKLDMQTPNFTDENIEKFAGLFPNCVTESKDDSGKLKKAIDFDLLKQELSENIVDGPRERYQINWPGKKEALVSANSPINKTLRPCREESVDFDTTENLYIEGDNLEALKLLQESYLGKVKMIYIDPPYNTGKDFVYKDNFTRSIEAELEASDQIDEQGSRLVANLESNGRFHSNWINMMLSRLKLSRNLLKDNGMIFISIDDNEVHNLRKVCDEIFGAENFVSTIVWEKIHSTKNDAKYLSDNTEFILLYAKNLNSLNIQLLPRTEAMNSRYKNPDNDERGEWSSGDLVANEPRKDGNYLVVGPTGKEFTVAADKHWVYKKENLYRMIDEGRIWFGKDGNSFPRLKRYLSEVQQGKKADTLWNSSDVGHNQEAKREVKKLFDGKSYFETPKPIRLIMQQLIIATQEDDIILDFFAGSGTTAHSIMQKNFDDKNNRKYILVQIPEETDEKSEAYKAGYKTISEIGKERIRRAGKKIKEENASKEGIGDLDVGFRVLKIDSSNMNDIYYTPDEVSQSQLPNMINSIKEDRTAEDLLFQVLLDWGVDLTLPIKREEIYGKTVYFVDEDTLVACFDDGLDAEFAKEIAARKPLRAVFKENGYKQDEDKINIDQVILQFSPDTEVRAI